MEIFFIKGGAHFYSLNRFGLLELGRATGSRWPGPMYARGLHFWQSYGTLAPNRLGAKPMQIAVQIRSPARIVPTWYAMRYKHTGE